MTKLFLVTLMAAWTWTSVVAADEGAVFDTATSWMNAPGSISIERAATDGRIHVRFDGFVESAAELGGPWVPMTAATSPFLTGDPDGLRFYRGGDLTDPAAFGSRSVAEWIIAGPLQQHFELAFAGMPDGIFPPRREKPYFDGSVTVAGRTIPVSLRVRGNSSLQECPFPKIKLKVSRKDREGTPFASAREVKIGTHCAEGGQGSIGRLRDERATFREALAYEAMELLGFVSPKVRRARIEFRDTSPGDDPELRGWTVTRMAMVLEDPEVVAERDGGRALSDEEVGALTNARFGAQLIADLRFLHVLLGNWDFVLTEDGRDLWNTDVIRRGDGVLVPLAGDFDLCSWVTAQVRSSAPWDYLPDLPERDRNVRFELQTLRQSLPHATFDAAAARFAARRADLELLVAAALVDAAGRTNAAAHVTTFFNGLTAVAGR
ncbi:MAG: hypothetical protein KF791_08900 [Verrucomicrobiae bacterium]|nr:hypothetical protein [Verrucomicrobiae bacterium]